VWMVNMTYDVPVKLLAFHLVLMSILLIAPDARRLINWFVLNRPVVPESSPRYGPSAFSNRMWMIGLLLYTTWALGLEVYSGAQGYAQYGPGAPKSPPHSNGSPFSVMSFAASSYESRGNGGFTFSSFDVSRSSTCNSGFRRSSTR